MKTRILLFGFFEPSFARSRVLIEGFRRNGYEVVLCRIDARSHGRFGKYMALARAGWRARHKGPYALVLTMFPGHHVVWLARLLFGKHVAFDAWHSIFDANVIDRRLYGRWSLRGVRDYILDWYSMRIAVVSFLHTRGTLEYVRETFGVPDARLAVSYTGGDDAMFSPRPTERHDHFWVHFHAVFTPVQGVDTIVDAGHFLSGEGVQIHIIGYGRRFFDRIKARVMDEGLSHVIIFEGRKPYAEMPAWIAKADVCLGVFGKTQKAWRMSIPTKLFECIAMRKAMITADTPVIRELFTDGETIILTKNDGQSLARAILRARDDAAFRERVAENAFALFKRSLTPETIVREIMRRAHTV